MLVFTQVPSPSTNRNTVSLLRSIFILDPLIWFYTVVMGALSLLSSLFDRSGRVQHWFARAWSKMILKTAMTPVRIVGLDRIDTSKPAVYAVNHGSALDIPALYATLPFQFRIVAKKELFRYPFLGWHLRRSGQISIDFEKTKRGSAAAPETASDAGAQRRARARGTVEALKRAVHTLKSGMPLLIFPEGGRCPDGHLQPFLGGAFWAAIRAGVDVVPMALVGPFEALPMNSFHIRPRPFELIVGEPISTAGHSPRDMDALTDRVAAVIADLYYSRARLPRPTSPSAGELGETIPS